jgi:hypothetical protein
MPAKQRGRGQTVPPEWLVSRVRGEYAEMPGLRVTLAQACPLWQVDTATCTKLFDHLVREGFLSKTASGFYVASQGTRRRN